MSEEKNDLLSLLSARGDLNPNNVRMLRIFIREWRSTPFEAVVESKVFSEGRLADLLAEELKLQRMQTIDPALVDRDVLVRVPYLEARRFSYLALNADQSDNKVIVALADPTDAAVLASIKTRLGSQVKTCVCTKTDIHFALNTAYSPEEQFGEGLS